jgi:hypothetical protein
MNNTRETVGVAGHVQKKQNPIHQWHGEQGQIKKD